MATIVRNCNGAVPEALTCRPLKFGDKDQIKALRDIDREASEGENLYTVTVSFSGDFTVNVRADSEEEAIEVARKEVDYCDDVEMDIHAKRKA